MSKTFSKIFVITIIVLLTVSGFSGNINKTKAQTNDPATYWMAIARNAWNFFAPGVGVDPETGMPQAEVHYHEYTDWDLATYVQAIIDAEQIGLINRTGDWGANDRINKVLTGLETRTLMPNGLPYIWYSSTTHDFTVNEAQVATDTGKLFVALNNLKFYDPTLQSRIDSLVYNHTNYEPRKISVDVLLGETINGIRSPNIYDYYITRGFACFWPERFNQQAQGILDVIMSREKVEYQGVSLPKAKILSDPLLMCMFEFQENDPRIVNLTRDMYLAQEARYNATGKYTASSEGGTGLEGIPFTYQWITLADGRMWVSQIVQQNGQEQEVSMSPIIFYKAAIGLQALFNTPYTQNMVNYLTERMPFPTQGYVQGVDEDGRVLSSINLGVANGVVVTSARYAIDHGVFVPDKAPTATNPPTQSSGSQTPAQKNDATVTDTTKSPLAENNPTPAPTPTTPKPSSTTPANHYRIPSAQPLPDPIPSVYYIMAAVIVTSVTLGLTIVVSKRKQDEDPDDEEVGWF